MIEIRNLQKVFRTGVQEVYALKDINLTIQAGEIFGIIGPSGAGKSTLVRCINMLERPSAGTVLVDGHDITKMNDNELRNMRRKIGMIFQHFNLLSSRTVFDNIAFPLEIAGVPKRQIKDKVAQLLELVGLQDRAQNYPAQLSGGQKQRVGIARALANDPKILLCDEATSALDPQTTKSILELLADINQKLGITMVVITHEMHVIKEICDRVAVISHGEIIEMGDVASVFTRPQTTLTREFVKTALNEDVAEKLVQDWLATANGFNEGPLIRIHFLGNIVGEPVISSLVRKFNVNANIIYAKIDKIKAIPFGTLILELTGNLANINAALQFLREQDLDVEVIAHASNAAGSAAGTATVTECAG